MENIKLFSGRKQMLAWISTFFVFAILFSVLNSCKEESVIPIDRNHFSNITSRGSDHLDLLGISCLPDSIFLCDSFATEDTMTIILPDYPGCSFLVKFEYFDCLIDSVQYYHIGDYRIISHNCPGFALDLNSAFTAGGQTLSTFVEDIDHDIFLGLKEGLAPNLISGESTPCGDEHVIFISYIRVSCFKLCYIDNGQTTTSVLVSCGSDCCIERTEVCRNELGNLLFQSSFDPDLWPHCGGPTIFNAGLPPRNCTSESTCEFVCPI